MAGRIFKIKDNHSCRKIYMFGVMCYVIKYDDEVVRHYLFGIPVRSYRLKRRFTADNPAVDLRHFQALPINDEVLLRELRNAGPFSYIPNGGNLGDMLIAAATIQFFDRHDLVYDLYRPGDKPDVIVYGGGGFWVGNYADGHEQILKMFEHARKIILLPGSYWQCDALIKAMDERFVIFCREKQSYGYLTSFQTQAKIILDHDMALRMQKDMLLPYDKDIAAADLRLVRILGERNKTGQDVGVFMRNDCERAEHVSGSVPSRIIQNGENSVDLSAFGFGTMFSSKEHFFFLALMMLCAVDGVKTVVTDRLHVGIAAVLMGKDVYLLDNSYKKISNVYLNSLQSFSNVHMCDKFPCDVVVRGEATDNFEKLLAFASQ